MGSGLSPAAVVDVSGDGQSDFGVYDTPLRLRGDTYTYLELVGNNSQAGLAINRAGASGWLAALNSGGLLRVSTMSAISQTGLTNAKDGAEGLTVDASGWLGLNTATPATNIHIVRNNANAMVVDGSGDGAINATTFRGLGFQYDNGDGAIMASYPGGVGQLTFWTTQTTAQERMRVTSGGQVAVGSTSPGSTKFYVRDFDDTTNADIAQFLSNNLTAGLGIGYNRIEAIGTNASGSIALIPKGTGAVGVGAAPNGPTLHVSGSIGATDWIGAGCEGACDPSNNGYSLGYANGDLIVYPGSTQSPNDTLGLYTGNGSLPGWSTSNYPTLKTSNSFMYFSAGGSYSAYMNSTGGWNAQSSRKKKENFEAIDRPALLDKIARLEVSQWNYKDQHPSIKHIAPIAESFHALFGLNGPDEKMLSHIDPAGVALAGLQGLIDADEARRAELDELSAEVERLRRTLQRRAGGR
jgi:hypothetical protein